MESNGSRRIDLQPRDLEILLGLFECRVMSLRHVAVLYFDGKTEAAKKRVQKLKQGGHIRERARSIGSPSLLHLTKAGFLALRESGKLDRFPELSPAAFEKRAQVSELTLRHELEVIDVRAALCTTIKTAPSLSVTEFSTWPLLYQFTARHNSPAHGRRELLMKPDGFMRIREETSDGVFEHMFFLEVDRSTETQEIIGQKAACYLDFYQSGGMAKRLGARREEFKEFPFRVFMVFKNDERRNNAAERLLKNNPPILTQVWLSTLAEVLGKPLGAIWMRPKDYLKVTRGGPFDPAPNAEQAQYKRMPDRERWINQKVSLQRLFD